MEIIAYQKENLPRILEIWEAAVVATHDFLSATDFQAIRTLVYQMDFDPFTMYVAWDNNVLCGFIGLQEDKVEMLFIHPEYFKQGIGRKLMEFVQEHHHTNQVDVNEQNIGAVAFYKRLGYEIAERSPVDGQGNAYPLLHLLKKV